MWTTAQNRRRRPRERGPDSSQPGVRRPQGRPPALPAEDGPSQGPSCGGRRLAPGNTAPLCAGRADVWGGGAAQGGPVLPGAASRSSQAAARLGPGEGQAGRPAPAPPRQPPVLGLPQRSGSGSPEGASRLAAPGLLPVTHSTLGSESPGGPTLLTLGPGSQSSQPVTLRLPGGVNAILWVEGLQGEGELEGHPGRPRSSVACESPFLTRHSPRARQPRQR